MLYLLGINYMPLWRNWQTHWIQNPAGNHVGSSPTSGTKIKYAPQKGAYFFQWRTLNLKQNLSGNLSIFLFTA